MTWFLAFGGASLLVMHCNLNWLLPIAKTELAWPCPGIAQQPGPYPAHLHGQIPQQSRVLLEDQPQADATGIIKCKQPGLLSQSCCLIVSG